MAKIDLISFAIPLCRLSNQIIKLNNISPYSKRHSALEGSETIVFFDTFVLLADTTADAGFLAEIKRPQWSKLW